MLCLTFSVGEKVQVGDVTVKVGEMNQGRIKMYFEGPREIPILREYAKFKTPKTTRIEQTKQTDK